MPLVRHPPAAFAQIAVLAVAAAGCIIWEIRLDIPSRLDALFTTLHDRGLFDGAVVVGTPDAIVWEKGFGRANRDSQTAFTPDTATDGASLAKTFTAALLLLLQQDGTLDLDDPAARFVPELPYPDVTLRHLLSHSSGIPVPDYDVFDALVPAGEVRTTETLAAAIGRAKPPLAFAPGTAFEYNSFGFDLALLAAARAATQMPAALYHARLFGPLEMTSPFLRPGRLTDFPGVRTRGYRAAGGGAAGLHDAFDLEAFHGGSNIYISARDLHRWNAAFFRSRPLDDDVRREALEPARINGAPSGLTLGSWYRNGSGTAFWYSGHLQGFHTEVFRDMPARRSIVYVSNNSVAPWLQKWLVRAVGAILDGQETAPPEPPAVAAIETGDRQTLAGRWTLPGGEILDISIVAGALSVQHDGVGYRMIQVAPDAFYVPGLDLVAGFAKADGRVTRMYAGTNLAERWATRAD